MTYSQKYSLVHFINPVDGGFQYHMADWPLHTTLADTFAIDLSSGNIEVKLANLCSQIIPVTVAANNDSVLGETPVILLNTSEELLALHTAVVELLEENGAVFNNPEFTKSGFIAHSTFQKEGRLHTGDVVTIDSISLVDMFPDDDWQQRKVLATFHLKS